MAVRHDVHSHAHEDIPGTVDLRAKEGEETHYGQALFPVPSADPNDPLQWPKFKKHMILFCCAMFSFLGNSALIGPSTYIGLYSAEFNIDPNTAAGLINYPNLAFGFGSLVLVPSYRKFGRRPVMLLSLIFYAAGLIGSAQSTTFSGLMGARVVHAFGSGVCEALPVQLVNDIFFLHERGKKLGWYTVALCLGATGPMFSGFMLAGGYSWNLFFYVEFAFAVALLILAFFFVEETQYNRVLPPATTTPTGTETNLASTSSEKADAAATGEHISEEHHPHHHNSTPSLAGSSTSNAAAIQPPRKTLLQQLKPWSPIDHSSPFFLTIARSFTYLLVPSTFWVITTYGLYIGLSGFAFSFTFPLKITAPPYNWPETSSGLHAIATIIGFGLALPLLPASDRLAAYLTKRNGGIREAEMRLGVLLPAMVIAPVGQIIFGITAEKNLHWLGYMFGVALTQWAGYFYFTVTLAYAVDSYSANLSEMLIIMNLGKQAISFGLGIEVLNWILNNGYAKVIAGAFTAVLLVNNMVVVVFMLWGKRIRVGTSKTWLARIHRASMVAGETH
ncbi:major facilitator superfamily domain-containing protein [Bombardia bombarda]|uniref:Major facilitator superfamily domain-containing protein n=1 Tax=Bombardia bombarda TaxID=252184 RepID=A0AA40C4H3_9PEZI|nr:major facilitator superfamily domain-containing protein [Bombardia bombarda]